MNQAFVIATSTKVNVGGVNVADVNDAFFKGEKKAVAKGAEGFFAAEKEAAVVPEAKKAKQAAVDAALVAGLDATTKAYLKDSFALSKGDRPHAMKF